jgi:hypothetical protein
VIYWFIVWLGSSPGTGDQKQDYTLSRMLIGRLGMEGARFHPGQSMESISESCGMKEHLGV